MQSEREEHDKDHQIHQLTEQLNECKTKCKQWEQQTSEYSRTIEQLHAQNRKLREETDATIESLRIDKMSASSLVQQKTLEYNQLFGMCVCLCVCV